MENFEVFGLINAIGDFFLSRLGTGEVADIFPCHPQKGTAEGFQVDSIMFRVLQKLPPGFRGHDSGGESHMAGCAVL